MVDEDRRGFGTRRDIGPCGGRDAMLDAWTNDGIGVERLDVEDDGDDVEIEPETSAQVRGLEKAIKDM